MLCTTAINSYKFAKLPVLQIDGKNISMMITRNFLDYILDTFHTEVPLVCCLVRI